MESTRGLKCKVPQADEIYLIFLLDVSEDFMQFRSWTPIGLSNVMGRTWQADAISKLEKVPFSRTIEKRKEAVYTFVLLKRLEQPLDVMVPFVGAASRSMSSSACQPARLGSGPYLLPIYFFVGL